MPVLHIQTNATIADQESLLKELSATVARELGKPESYVMVSITHNPAMSFAGTLEPLVYAELKSLGLASSQTAGISQSLCSLIEQRLGVDASRIYIEFSAPERAMFGWNGGTF